MTKKFWNDWQKRKGETKDEIVEINFDNNNDYVYITVNHCYTVFSNGNVHFRKELMNHSYHRTDIKNIEFIKY